MTMLQFKDKILDDLAETANVAQFVSFGPDVSLPQRFSRVHGYPANHRYASPGEAIEAVLERSAGASVNVRSFDPASPKGRSFIYGLRRREEVMNAVRGLAGDRLYTIVNETIDVHDGGVSGVVLGDVVEFAPDDTPRCVEEPGTAALERHAGLRLLETVYGFRPALDYDKRQRVEFSLHPLRVGVRHEHTIVWEIEQMDPVSIAPGPAWPNRWSRVLGDKAFGLLIADLFGFPVPMTTVVGRRIAPFRFGRPTGSGETWIRTCPTEQVPGRFTTKHGWVDPFTLLAAEDADGKAIVSVIAQSGVDSQYAGAALPGPDGRAIIEGVAGFGDQFMVGASPPVTLPREVIRDVEVFMEHASAKLGSVRMEWAHDGREVWVLQLHLAGEGAQDGAIVQGEAERWRPYDPRDGLEALRALIELATRSGEGIIVTGQVGITSHVGDLLRKAGIPARFGKDS
jgi:hypothetical protein